MASAGRRVGRSKVVRMLESLEPRVMLTVTLDPLASIYGSSITLPAGKSIEVPLTATNTLSGALTYTVTSSNKNLVPLVNAIDPAVSKTRTFIQVNTSLGNMVFQLYNDVAPVTTGYDLANLNGPDFTNVLFYRLIEQDLGLGEIASFVQAGDRNNDGSNPAGVAIQQEFDPRVMFTGHGQLAVGQNSIPDSGSTDFFITLATQRQYDFHYTIFGQLVRGWDVLTAINSLPIDSNDRPLNPPTLQSISVISDPTDAVMTLVSTSLTPVSGTLTVTAKDAFGHSASEVINVSTSADAVNDAPYLANGGSVVNRAIPKNTTTAVVFGSAVDVEGDAAVVQAHLFGAANYTASFNSTTLFITPNTGYSGPIQVVVTVAQKDNTSLTTGRLYTFFVDSGAAPTYSALATDVYESAGTFKTFTITYKDDTLVNAATLIGNNSLVTVKGPNGYSAPAVYKSISSSASAASLTVTYVIPAPGGSWNAPDAGAYTISVKGGVVKDTTGHASGAAVAGTFYYSPTVFFDERYYLAMNPSVAAAVRAGKFTSGYQHFLLFGQQEGLAASPYFNEKIYLELNPDIAAAVRRGTFKSGWQHFVQFGAREGRVASEVFNEKEYLAMNPDIAAAVAKGTFNSGFEHFILHGQFEGRNPSLSFNLTNYETLYPGVVTAVATQAAGLAQTVTEHFIIYGEQEGLVATSLFNETYYLAQNPDVAAAVAAGTFRSGFEHFILFGAHEGRSPSTGFDSAFYLSQYPDVAAAVANGTFNSAYQHYIENGMAEGRLPHA